MLNSSFENLLKTCKKEKKKKKVSHKIIQINYSKNLPFIILSSSWSRASCEAPFFSTAHLFCNSLSVYIISRSFHFCYGVFWRRASLSLLFHWSSIITQAVFFYSTIFFCLQVFLLPCKYVNDKPLICRPIRLQQC